MMLAATTKPLDPDVRQIHYVALQLLLRFSQAVPLSLQVNCSRNAMCARVFHVERLEDARELKESYPTSRMLLARSCRKACRRESRQQTVFHVEQWTLSSLH